MVEINHDYHTLYGFMIDAKHGKGDNAEDYRDKCLYVHGNRLLPRVIRDDKGEHSSSIDGLIVTKKGLGNSGDETMRVRHRITIEEVFDNTFENAGVHYFVFNGGGKNSELLYMGTSSHQWSGGKNPTINSQDDSIYIWIHHNKMVSNGNEAVDVKESAQYVLVQYNDVPRKRIPNRGVSILGRTMSSSGTILFRGVRVQDSASGVTRWMGTRTDKTMRYKEMSSATPRVGPSRSTPGPTKRCATTNAREDVSQPEIGNRITLNWKGSVPVSWTRTGSIQARSSRRCPKKKTLLTEEESGPALVVDDSSSDKDPLPAPNASRSRPRKSVLPQKTLQMWPSSPSMEIPCPDGLPTVRGNDSKRISEGVSPWPPYNCIFTRVICAPKPLMSTLPVPNF